MMRAKKYLVKVVGVFALVLLAQSAMAVTCTSVATTQTDWNKQFAWDAACGGQPPAGATVIIASGTSILADANTANVANITINAGGTLAIQGGNTISLSGNFTNNGTFTAPANSTVSFTGTNQTISGNVTFANLQLSATTVLTLTGNITVTGTLTGTLNLASTCPANYTITDGAGAVIGQSCPLTLTAEYLFEEPGWNGTTGEVADTGGNGYNGTASGVAPLPTTASVSPRAIDANPGTCNYGAFDGVSDYVAIPGFPKLTTDFTITAWIRTTNNAKSGQRIVIDDQNNTGGYGLSLGDGGTGRLRFYARGSSNIILDTPNVIANNTWYFVAAVADITNNMRYLYVYDATGNQLAAVNTVSTGWGTDAGVPSIGGETNASAETGSAFHFSGNIDEVRVYANVLTPAQLAGIQNQTHVCASGINHVAISAPTTAMAYSAVPVTITPHNAAHIPLSGATIYLTTSTGLGDWTIGTGTGTLTPGAANSGVASYTYGPGETSATLDFTYQTSGTVTLNVSDAAGADMLLSTPVAEKANVITFTIPSYVFTNSACVNNIAFGAAGQTCLPLSWSPQVAGQDVQNVYITVVNAAGVPTRLSRTQVRTQNMQFALSCHDPVANAGVQAAFAATTLPLCQANGATPAAWSPTMVASFPANVPSAGPYIFNYADVGKVELWMRSSTTKVGASGVFVVKPGGFVLSAIKRTSDNFANPAAASAAGAAFAKAGEAFSVTVTATTCSPASATCTVVGAATPNYGKEIAPESVKLTSALVTGLGLTSNPSISCSDPANTATCDTTSMPGMNIPKFGAFGNGVATGSNFAWSEVGIIKLSPSVGDGSYLGAGDVVGTSSGNVGRFYPDHFDTAVVLSAGVPLACPDSTCPAAYNGMVYSAQPFSLTVTAKNLNGGTTANYNTVSGFAKTTTLGAFGALGTTSAPAGAGTLGVPSVTAFTGGMLTEAAEKYTFTAVPTAPTNIYIRASDGEASSLRTINPTVTSIEGGVKVASGHIKVSNAYGSELLPLTLVATAQYYTATGWVNSITDNVTNLTLAASYNVVKNGITTGATTPAPTGATTLVGGQRSIILGKPTNSATGTATINPAVPSYLPLIPGAANFGVYKGTKEIIYMRETY